MRSILLIGAVLVGACSSAPQKESRGVVLRPSELNSKATYYDGKPVTVQGWIVLGFEKRYLVDDKRSYEEWPNDNVCVTLVNAGDLLSNQSKYNNKQVELKGTFRKNVLHEGVIRLGSCNTSGLEIDPNVVPRVL